MRSRIELLCRVRDFDDVASQWPTAVETSERIVIPRFCRLSPATSITAELHSDGTIALRPAIEGRAGFASMRRRVIRDVESALDVSLSSTPANTSVGTVYLEEEWGDFAIVLVPIASLTEPLDAFPRRAGA